MAIYPPKGDTSISSRGSLDFSSYFICLRKRTLKKKKGHRSIVILAEFFSRKVLFTDGRDGMAGPSKGSFNFFQFKIF